MTCITLLASIGGEVPDPPAWLMAPFVLLLAAIALMHMAQAGQQCCMIQKNGTPLR